MPHINIQYFNSSCGLFVLASFGDKLCLCDWSNNPCAERNKRRIERYLNASFKIETTSILETIWKNQANWTQFEHKQHKRRRAYIKEL